MAPGRVIVSATAIHTKAATGPDQIRKAVGTGTGSHGRTSKTSSDSGQAGAPFLTSAATPSAAASTIVQDVTLAGSRPIRDPEADANPIVPSESQAMKPAHSASSNRAAVPEGRIKDVKTVDVCDR